MDRQTGPGESLLKVLVRRQRTQRSPRGVRFEPEVSADRPVHVPILQLERRICGEEAA